MPPKKIFSCQHEELQVEPSAHAAEAGFERVSPARRVAATTVSGRSAKQGPADMEVEREAMSFPGPLVLPGDDLSWDPKYKSQSFRSWLHEKARNEPSPRRKHVYVAAQPAIDSELSVMATWADPILPVKRQKAAPASPLGSPKLDDVCAYLSAFYHSFPVEPLPSPLRFVPWGAAQAKSERNMSSAGADSSNDTMAAHVPAFVGLASAATSVRIRTRECPDGRFARQLNLLDLLDAAEELLPDNGYAILLLMEQDLYEDEEDDFCCGRAFGGSRIAVVSAARYHPALDDGGIDRAHMWPASHCNAFVRRLAEGPAGRRKTGMKPDTSGEGGGGGAGGGALRAAVAAARAVRPPETDEALYGLWFSRVCRTASHELGHCFGMGHCAYYACVMQGTAGTAEDYRQPPYLCPVCLKKLTCAASRVRRNEPDGYELERYRALAAVCETWAHVGMFAGYQAWLGHVAAAG